MAGKEMRINLRLKDADDRKLFMELESTPLRRRSERMRQLAYKGLEYEQKLAEFNPLNKAMFDTRLPLNDGGSVGEAGTKNNESSDKEIKTNPPDAENQAKVAQTTSPKPDSGKSAFGDALADLDF